MTDKEKGKFCTKCYYKTMMGKICTTCSDRKSHICDACRKKTMDGELISGLLLCEKCTLDEHTRRKNYRATCFKNDICYKCDSSATKIERVIYSEKTDAYELSDMDCPICGPLFVL